MAINNRQLSLQGLQNGQVPGAPIKVGGEGNWLMGYNQSTTHTPVQTPNAMNALNQTLQMGLQNSNQPASFDPYEANARRNYSQYDVPSIMERITSMGQNLGPGAGLELSHGYSNLESQLAEARSRFNQGQQQFGLQQLQTGLTPQYETNIQPASEGHLNAILSLLGMILGGATTGGAGAGIGGAAGGVIAQLLQKWLSGGGGGGNNNFNINDVTKGFGSNGWYPQQISMSGQQNNEGLHF